MLKLNVGYTEGYNEETQEFVQLGGTVLEFEHSLFSLSKWESKWELPFIQTKEKTEEQVFDYFRMMYLGDEFPEELLSQFTEVEFTAINKYIGAEMTATTFRNQPPTPGNREIITAEIIYYWMVTMNIPFECQYWHLNRLLTLVKVVNEKNKTPEQRKLSRAELAARNRELNAQRRAELGTRG